MANELRLAHTTTGEPIYAIVRNENGDPWNFGAGAFNTYDASNFSNYTLNMTEQGGSRYYHAPTNEPPFGKCTSRRSASTKPSTALS